MSVSTLQNVMLRIRTATPESPIAVFLCAKPGPLDAVFAATVITRSIIARQDPALIGVFDRTMNEREVKEQLRRHLHETH
jgi:hypothetical protein